MTFFNKFPVKETATLTWTVPGSLQVTRYILSPEFSPPNSVREFQLELKANNSSFGSKHVFFNLFYNGDIFENDDELFRYSVSILDVSGRKHYTKEYLWHYNVLRRDYIGRPGYEYYKYNATNYMPLVKCEQFLVNGHWNLYCEVDILDTKLDQLPPQQTGSFAKLSQNYETFLENGQLCDFIVLIGTKEFRVHKAILAAQSAVFAAMFQHDETKEMKEGRVVIEDITVEVFEALVRYIYTGKVESLDEFTAELFVAADRYQLDHLKSICEQSLISSLAIESVSSVLLLSDMHNAAQLKSKCIEYIVYNWKDVKETNCWKKEIKGKRADLIEDILDGTASNQYNSI